MSTLSDIDNPRSFWEEARAQRVCAACKCRTHQWEAHHALQKQRCRAVGAPLHSPDDSLRLCSGSAESCHERHTAAQERVPLSALRDENIAFAVRWLGAGPAFNYLSEQYAGTDPRVDHLLEVIG